MFKKILVVTTIMFLFTGCTPTDPNLAQVDKVSINIMESFPVQVNSVIEGTLKGGCEQIGEIKIKQTDTGFDIKVPKEPTEEVCTQTPRLFKITVPLESFGLKKGKYEVNVQGVSQSFELETDNIIPE